MAGTTSRSGGPRTGRVGRHEGVLGAAGQASRREAAAPAVALHRPRADSGAEGAQQPRILGVARGRLRLSPGRGLRSPGVPQAQQQPPRPRADPLSRQPARGDPRGRRAGASRQAGPNPGPPRPPLPPGRGGGEPEPREGNGGGERRIKEGGRRRVGRDRRGRGGEGREQVGRRGEKERKRKGEEKGRRIGRGGRGEEAG